MTTCVRICLKSQQIFRVKPEKISFVTVLLVILLIIFLLEKKRQQKEHINMCIILQRY